ncbi:hypothetical protein [Solicola sp. PLA-1-18]|uniref:divisome protein SepX/GlpR n=1 Tax=Solicola sp. PLA-1-18 TaxID=3380532 RepID=UPI003B7E1900
MAAGLVFAAIVVLWAAYFVPLALRRYDEAARSGAAATLTARGRVLRRAEADDTDAAEPAPTVTTDQRTEDVPVDTVTAAPTGRAHLDRPAARLAAQRRRRTLITLLTALVVVVALAATAVLPWWSVAVPGALVVVWLVACRIQVRGELGLAVPHAPQMPSMPAMPQMPRRRHDEQLDELDEEQARRLSDAEDTVVISGQVEDHDPHRVHVMEDVPLVQGDVDEVVVDAVPVTATTGATLWDPLPVTLPTYVDKPRAARTVRTIDFGEQGTWTSGHVEGEQTERPARARTSEERRRAVGD